MAFFDRMKIKTKSMDSFEKAWSSEPPTRNGKTVWTGQAGSENNVPGPHRAEQLGAQQFPQERTYMDPKFMRVQKAKARKAAAARQRGSDSASVAVPLTKESPLGAFGEVFKNYKHGEACKCEGCVKKYAGKKY